MRQLSDDDWAFFLLGPCAMVPEDERGRLRKLLSRYLELLLEANERLNLTAIRSWEDGVWKHLYDSLLVAPIVPRGTLLDWGTGGGAPGIPVALWRRALGNRDAIVLLDSVQKKISQVSAMVEELALEGVTAVCGRGERYLGCHDVDSVVMRAVAPPERAIRWMSSRSTKWVFMVGPVSREAWIAARPALEKRDWWLASDTSHELPNGRGQRHILEFRAGVRSTWNR